MHIPPLSPGKRHALPRPVGSADALLLAQWASRECTAGRRVAVVTTNANDAQRLLEEMVFFAPSLRCVLFPDWETLPYDTFSPHQDLISERLATLWRISERDRAQGVDVVLMPATTALYRLAPPSFLAGYTFELPAVPDRLVTIRANAREVGAGELVDLGDKLGVRIVNWNLA